MTGFSVPLADCAALPDQQVGGKARGLGGLLASGLPVPDGVCLHSGALELVLSTAAVRPAYDRLVTAVEQQPAHRSAAASALRATLATAPMPQALAAEIRAAATPLVARGLVAVRSSAAGEDGDTSARAGVYTSVIGVPDVDSILDAVRRCWMSLYTSRAMAVDGSARAAMAVIIQEMAEAAQIGVLFTVDPVSAQPGTIVVEYADRHDAVTSGAGSSARIRIEPDDEPPGLPLPAAAFRDLARRLEALLEGPADAEWAVRDGQLTLLQARRVTTASAPKPGWADQEDLAGMNRLRLGRCQPMFDRSLQKKVWFRTTCRDAGFDVYGVTYVTYQADLPEPVVEQVLDHLRSDVLQVNLGNGAQPVHRDDLVEHLKRQAYTNPVGVGLSTAQVGEVVLADTTGFSTMLPDGSLWIEVFPAGLSGIKSGARQPTIYRVGPHGSILDRKAAMTTEVAHYDLAELAWRTEDVEERPVDVSPTLLDRVAEYTRALSKALGEARLEWYAIGDHLYAKDVSLESAALSMAGDAIAISGGVVQGPVLRIDDLSTLDAYADEAGVSVYAHGDEDAGFGDPLQARLEAGQPAPIVVAEYPSIGLIPSIGRVAGFVFSRGTLLSHTAIALREHGVPGIIDGAAARVLRDGDVVMLTPTGVVLHPFKGSAE
jgi:phosphohistidine swiveling domain-containing protein